MKKEIEELIKKWEKTGLLDDIDGILEKKDLVKLMEGKASQLLREEKSILVTFKDESIFKLRIFKFLLPTRCLI